MVYNSILDRHFLRANPSRCALANVDTFEYERFFNLFGFIAEACMTGDTFRT